MMYHAMIILIWMDAMIVMLLIHAIGVVMDII